MMPKNLDYCEVDYYPGEKHLISYRTGLTSYDEEFRNGSIFGAGWNTAGFPIKIDSRNDRTKPEDYIIEPAAFHLEINGRCADYGYEFVDFTSDKTEKGIHTVLKLKNTIFPINLNVHTVIDATQTISRWMEVENLSDDPLCLSRIGIFNNVLEIIEKADGSYRPNLLGEKYADIDNFYNVGYFADAGWAAEGEFDWHLLEPNTEKVVDMRYHHSKFRHPLLFIRSNVLGRMWYCQVAWTAGVKFEIEQRSHLGRKRFLRKSQPRKQRQEHGQQYRTEPMEPFFHTMIPP